MEKRPAWSQQLRKEICQDVVKILERATSFGALDGNCELEIRYLPADTAIDLRGTIAGHVSFSRQWLHRHGLVPSRCSVMSVTGKSMEPTLPEGASILVDRVSSHRAEGRIYVIRTPRGLVVKRVSKDRGGCWWLISDHFGWKPARWPSGAEIVGEVRWVGRFL